MDLCITLVFLKKTWLTFGIFSRLVQTMDYSVIVFDTAPTGHTLRLLQFPSTLEKGLAKIMSLKNRFGGLLSQVWFALSLSVLQLLLKKINYKVETKVILPIRRIGSTFDNFNKFIRIAASISLLCSYLLIIKIDDAVLCYSSPQSIYFTLLLGVSCTLMLV